MHIALPYLHQGQRKEDLIAALRLRCADGFNFNGPMFEFVRLAQTAALDGLPCWHGSEVDLGILEASALHACSVTENCTIPSDIFGELVRENDLIEPGLRFENGYALVPTGPGLGVELDHAALEKFRIGPSVELRA
jgi:muconate cycloisomerase